MGDTAFEYFPAKKSGRAYKFARPFQGPYLVKKVFNNGVQVKKIGQSRCKPLRVSLNRIRKCPKELTKSNFEEDDPEVTPQNTEDLQEVQDSDNELGLRQCEVTPQETEDLHEVQDSSYELRPRRCVEPSYLKDGDI